MKPRCVLFFNGPTKPFESTVTESVEICFNLDSERNRFVRVRVSTVQLPRPLSLTCDDDGLPGHRCVSSTFGTSEDRLCEEDVSSQHRGSQQQREHGSSAASWVSTSSAACSVHLGAGLPAAGRGSPVADWQLGPVRPVHLKLCCCLTSTDSLSTPTNQQHPQVFMFMKQEETVATAPSGGESLYWNVCELLYTV